MGLIATSNDLSTVQLPTQSNINAIEYHLFLYRCEFERILP